MRLKDSSERPRGRCLYRREFSDFIIDECLYNGGLRQSKHSHELASFGILLQGSYTEQVGSGARTCSPSALVLRPPHEDHSVEFHDRPARIFRVEIKPRWLERMREYSPVLDGPAYFQGGPPAWLASRLYQEVRLAGAASALVVEGLALATLGEAYRPAARGSEPRPPRRIQQARELIHARFAESLGLSEIAAEVGLHPVYLAREFRKHYGSTVGEYARGLRVEFACHKISESDAPLAEIACAAGFYDQSHFSNAFKRHTGMSPADYRMVFRRS
ncbi:MAG: helix-turn-helix domain-containing protein [Blastocatellia bacterium]